MCLLRFGGRDDVENFTRVHLSSVDAGEDKEISSILPVVLNYKQLDFVRLCWWRRRGWAFVSLDALVLTLILRETKRVLCGVTIRPVFYEIFSHFLSRLLFFNKNVPCPVRSTKLREEVAQKHNRKDYARIIFTHNRKNKKGKKTVFSGKDLSAQS